MGILLNEIHLRNAAGAEFRHDLVEKFRAVVEIVHNLAHAPVPGDPVPGRKVQIVPSHQPDGHGIPQQVGVEIHILLIHVGTKGKFRDLQIFQVLFLRQHVVVAVGNDVVFRIRPQDILFDPLFHAVAGGIVSHPHPEEGIENGVGVKILPAVQGLPEIQLHGSGSGILAQAGQLVVDIDLVPGDLVNQHRRPDELQVVGVPHPLIHFLLFVRQGHFHVLFGQFPDDFLVGLIHGSTSGLSDFSQWLPGPQPPPAHPWAAASPPHRIWRGGKRTIPRKPG